MASHQSSHKIKCKQCSSPTPDNLKVCPHCGAILEAKPFPFVGWILAALVIIGTFYIFVIFLPTSQEQSPPSSQQRASSDIALPETPAPTSTPLQTVEPIVLPTATPTPLPTETPTDTPTNTPIPPTETPIPPTNTPIPPTETPIPPTDTPIPPTETPIPPTDTPVPPTATSSPTNTPIPTETFTPLPNLAGETSPPTDTPVPENTATNAESTNDQAPLPNLVVQPEYKYPPIELIGPAPEEQFEPDHDVNLSWQPVGALAENEWYAVRIRWSQNGDLKVGGHNVVDATSWVVPYEFYERKADVENGVYPYEWFVFVEGMTTDENGKEKPIPLSPESKPRRFIWKYWR